MTTVRPKEWTYEEFMALPEGGPLRYEIIDGELTMTPAPNTRHQEISGNLFAMIHLFLSRNPLGKVFSAPYDVILSHDPLRAVEPDLVVVSRERLSSIGEKNIEGAPDLLVEILSEGTEKRDRREKFSLYERSGVSEYWIVDPESQTVQVFRLSGTKYPSPLEFRRNESLSTPLFPGLSIPLSEVFPS